MQDVHGRPGPDGENVVRYNPDAERGLGAGQVEQRQQAGLVNEYKSNTTKTYRQIFKDNFLTFFNILNMVFAVLLLSVGAYKDLSFLVLVVANLTIGLVQEITSKRTLDKLSVIVAAKARVVRDGAVRTVNVGELVLDDVTEVKTGDQICADSVVLSGYVEVNESLISGESDVIAKKAGDYLYSGSFVVSGTARARVDHIGADNYANQISASARAAKKRESQLYSTLGIILRIISIIILPMGIMLFYKQAVILGLGPSEGIVKTVAALIGMVPEGLILMTSIALVTSTIFLAYDKTLVQDSYGIETMARADIVCLDKTGTLTEGKLTFDSVVMLRGAGVENAMRNICGAIDDENATMQALRGHYAPAHKWEVRHVIPFSSQRKYSGVSFACEGTYMLGAAEFLLPGGHAEVKAQEAELAADGHRVILLAHSPEVMAEGNELPGGLTPLAFLLLSDKLRGDTKDTLAFFDKQEVQLKIISGDHPQTVARIAQEAGLRNADSFVDASTLETDEQLCEAALAYNVFGRVTPEQKKKMVVAMRGAGHTVAMMGDGVNDVLALKAANCSVAVASGSDAAKNISDIVLMDSNLTHLKHVVDDGRKVINNIQRVATLFITKTVYSVLLALATLFLFESAYPFTPLHLVAISFVTIGAPSFFLALEPNRSPIRGRFIRNVLAKSLPGGLCIFLSIIAANLLAGVLECTPNQLSTMCVYLATAGGMWVLWRTSRPLTRLRKIILIGMIGLFALGMWVWPGPGFFEIYDITTPQIVALAVMIVVMPFLMQLLEWIVRKVTARIPEKKNSRLARTLKAVGEQGVRGLNPNNQSDEGELP